MGRHDLPPGDESGERGERRNGKRGRKGVEEAGDVWRENATGSRGVNTMQDGRFCLPVDTTLKRNLFRLIIINWTLKNKQQPQKRISLGITPARTAWRHSIHSRWRGVECRFERCWETCWLQPCIDVEADGGDVCVWWRRDERMKKLRYCEVMNGSCECVLWRARIRRVWSNETAWCKSWFWMSCIRANVTRWKRTQKMRYFYPFHNRRWIWGTVNMWSQSASFSEITIWTKKFNLTSTQYKIRPNILSLADTRPTEIQ